MRDRKCLASTALEFNDNFAVLFIYPKDFVTRPRLQAVVYLSLIMNDCTLTMVLELDRCIIVLIGIKLNIFS